MLDYATSLNATGLSRSLIELATVPRMPRLVDYKRGFFRREIQQPASPHRFLVASNARPPEQPRQDSCASVRRGRGSMRVRVRRFAAEEPARSRGIHANSIFISCVNALE